MNIADTWKKLFFKPLPPPYRSCLSFAAPYGGDEYRCIRCHMIWSRDEAKPSCPDEA